MASKVRLTSIRTRITGLLLLAVVIGGIANLRCSAEESKFKKRLYEQTSAKFKESDFKSRCEKRSIINFPQKLSHTTPLLIIHGNNDEQVTPNDSIDLSYKLLELKFPYRLVMLEDGDHFLKSHRKEVDEMKRNWFEKYLRLK